MYIVIKTTGLLHNIPSFLRRMLRPSLLVPSNAPHPVTAICSNYAIPSPHFISDPSSQLWFVVLAHAEVTCVPPVSYFKHKGFKVGLIFKFPEIVAIPSCPSLIMYGPLDAHRSCSRPIFCVSVGIHVRP